MTALVQNQPTLVETLWQGDNALARNIVLAVVGSLALWASAKIQVPFFPVPITMQTFVVLVIGMTFGWRLGGATFALYLAEGAIGLPVFAGTPEKGIGMAYMIGPTGGYLLGMLLATMCVGWLAQRGWDRRILTTAAAMVGRYRQNRTSCISVTGSLETSRKIAKKQLIDRVQYIRDSFAKNSNKAVALKRKANA